MHPLVDSNTLLDYHLVTLRRSSWKTEPQKYNCRFLKNNLDLKKSLASGTYQTSEGSEFLKKERGRTRRILGRRHKDRIVRNILCEKILGPELERFLFWNNSASREGKGVSFARNNFERDLHNFYLEYGDNDGYVLFFDFSKYFDNIVHSTAKEQIYPHVDPVTRSVLDEIISNFRVDISALSRAEREGFMSSTFNSVKYFNEIQKEQRTGECFADKSIDIGDRVSQNIACLYATRIDNWVKNVGRIKRYGRYNDDGYVICRDRERAKEILKGVLVAAKSLGIFINLKKTRICKLSSKYKFLQIRYSLDANGRVVKRINPKAITRERRKLKAYRRLVHDSRMSLEQVIEAYKSWLGNFWRLMSRRQLESMSSLFTHLFGVTVRWKQK